MISFQQLLILKCLRLQRAYIEQDLAQSAFKTQSFYFYIS